MNEATLQAFRDLAASMQTEPQDWQWIGPHMSQRMFGISQSRAKEYAARHGGIASPLPLPPPVVDIWWIDDNDGCGPRKLSAPIRCF